MQVCADHWQWLRQSSHDGLILCRTNVQMCIVSAKLSHDAYGRHLELVQKLLCG